MQRVEAGGFKLTEARKVSDELLLDEFAYSLAETANRLCTDEGSSERTPKSDGILILIDEADKGSKGLHLGSFFKLLSERLQRRSCNRVMFGLAGLPELRKVMHESHPSSLRIFDELVLERLSVQEVNRVIDSCLEEATRQPEAVETIVLDDARTLLVTYSEGYPHFIQQFGYSAFAHDDDNVIDRADVQDGAFGPGGAFEQIGDRYYRNDFYKKIQKESYRKVLRIMAENLDGWVTKQEIRALFRGSDSVLNSALKALRDRKIIRPKEGELGVYRLQHKAFAAWIRYYTDDPDEVQRLALSDSPTDADEA